MSLLDDYKKSLKPLDVEEPIDVWVHRPLAYLLARVLYPTPVSPNAVTVFSIVCGVIAGICLIHTAIPHRMPLAGLFVFLSAVVDCADGQLARMRKTSSNFGRMLDGMADAVVTTVIVACGAVEILRDHAGSRLEQVVYISLIVVAAWTGTLHTASYDHYKNLFLRVTNEKYQEGEDMVTALARRQQEKAQETPFLGLVWWVYLSYFNSQDRFGLRYDPYTTRRINSLPPYDEERARIFRRHNATTMRAWRGLFGVGSMIFQFAVFSALDALEWFVAYRAIVLNLVFFAWLMPRQRRASRDGFAEMGLAPPR